MEKIIKKSNFVHLHVHTEYSLLDGAIRVKSLFEKASELGMPAVAITDHGNLYGALEFYKMGINTGVKPIIGCEIYLSPGSMYEKVDSKGRKRNYHLTLLAKNNTGYDNLVKLTSRAHREGMYYGKPRVDKKLLEEYSQGLICLSGCISGEPNQYILKGDFKGARNSIGEFKDIFGKENFFLEVQDNGYSDQLICTKKMIEFSKEFNIPLVASNDVHFLEKVDQPAHDVMICIGTGSKLSDESRMRYTSEVYFKPEQEMRKSFAEMPEALTNTLEIAKMCDLKLEINPLSTEKYPKFTPPENKKLHPYFISACKKGLKDRYGEKILENEKFSKRMVKELDVIIEKGFASYYLIVADFIQWARDQGIPVGPGRGSAAGSLMAYALGITNICPIKYGLIFERFLNPERTSPPDVDIDFCQSRRGEVLEYVRNKYGAGCVSHIITFGRLGAKMVVRDVARVYGLSYAQGDRMAKMIPTDPGITLKEAEKLNPEIKKNIKSDEEFKEVWRYAEYLEGLKRGVGVHAAGIVIGDQELDNFLPLSLGKDGEVVTQFEMDGVSELGLLKMDFLGLKTLTVINMAQEIIRKTQKDFDIENVSLNDDKTFEMLNMGNTCGVFQLESGGMVNLCKKFQIDSIDDIIALIALYRPGPMDLIPDYINRKKGKKKISYLHPLLKEVSEDTFGIMIYQEQVIRAANLLAGYSMGDGDELRRAMGKKKKEIMEKERDKFVKGCKKKNDIPEAKANKIFDLLEKFAGYGFNKSHSAAYGLISYQTAFLKANYPVEFMSSLLCNEINNTDKISVFVEECKNMGISILPPDINKSFEYFTPEKSDIKNQMFDSIRYGLAAIKNVGKEAMRRVILERERNSTYTSLDDFVKRLDSKSANRKILESLIKSGALDDFNTRRDELFSKLDYFIASAASYHKDKSSGQESLFEDFDYSPAVEEPASEYVYGKKEIWGKEKLLMFEKELLGFYVTGHPLDPYKKRLSKSKYNKIGQISELSTDREYNFGAFLIKKEIKYTKKKNEAFAILKLEDFTGNIDGIMWPQNYEKFSNKLVEGQILRITARIVEDSDVSRLILSSCGILKRDEDSDIDIREEKKVDKVQETEIENEDVKNNNRVNEIDSESISSDKILEGSKKDMSVKKHKKLPVSKISQHLSEKKSEKKCLDESGKNSECVIRVSLGSINRGGLEKIREIVSEYPGESNLKIQIFDPERKEDVSIISRTILINDCNELRDRLKNYVMQEDF